MTDKILFFEGESNSSDNDPNSPICHQLMIVMKHPSEALLDSYVETIYRVQEEINNSDFDVSWITTLISVRSQDKAALMTLRLALN